MIKRFKKALGIEDVKLQLTPPTFLDLNGNVLEGVLHITSMTDSTISEIELKLIERYQRGKNDRQKINEYLLGRSIHREPISLKAGESLDLPFKLKYVIGDSQMDKLGKKGILFKSLSALAKKINGVSSTYKLIAEADVKGTKLSPFVESVLVPEPPKGKAVRMTNVE